MGVSESNGGQPCQAIKENAPHEAGHYLILVARGGIDQGHQDATL